MTKNFEYLSSLQAKWSEPEEPSIVGKDYKGDDLYFGDECFKTDEGFVLAEDVYEYMEQRFGKVVEVE